VLKDTKAKACYAIGLNIGRRLKADIGDIDSQALSKGIQDALAGGKTLLTPQEIEEVMTAFQKDIEARQLEKVKTLSAKNKQEGAAFLAANRKKQGVSTLPSGLQFKVLKEGTGPIPKATDTVSTHYRGTLLDGTEFDSSIARGEPATFEVGGVIRGWTEALQKMKVGSKWQLFVPAELAYGADGFPPDIAPHATLVFEVELLGIGEPTPPGKEIKP
jgi:FKBP-type peptidyl-prolyl cis-trans isomerase FklB